MPPRSPSDLLAALSQAIDAVTSWTQRAGGQPPSPEDLSALESLAADAAGLVRALSQMQLADHPNGELQIRAANLELLDDLLTSLIETGDLKHVFERIMAITQ